MRLVRNGCREQEKRTRKRMMETMQTRRRPQQIRRPLKNLNKLGTGTEEIFRSNRRCRTTNRQMFTIFGAFVWDVARIRDREKRTKKRESCRPGQPGGQGYWGSIGVARGRKRLNRVEETRRNSNRRKNGENGEKSIKASTVKRRRNPEDYEELQVEQEGSENLED